jgi:hypothetical protein
MELVGLPQISVQLSFLDAEQHQQTPPTAHFENYQQFGMHEAELNDVNTCVSDVRGNWLVDSLNLYGV